MLDMRSKSGSQEFKLRHIVTADMNIGVFPFKDDITVVISVWERNNNNNKKTELLFL